MGRTATGVRGIRLREDDYVVGAGILEKDSEVLIVTEKGYGKRTSADQYSIKKRGGLGVKTADIRDKSGKLAGLMVVDGSEDILIMTDQGIAIRMKVKNISQTSRATLGVRVIRLDEAATVSSATIIIPTDEDDADIEDLEVIDESEDMIEDEISESDNSEDE